MTPKKSRKHWIGFDLGGTKMQATLFDPDFKIINRERCRTKGHEGVDIGLERMVKTIQDVLDSAGIDAGELGGIGVGCPGPLNLDEGVILDTPNLGWKNVPLKKHLEKILKCPVVILNDVDAGVYGEYRFGAGEGTRCVLGVFPGTGIGGGCVYEGSILRGRTGSCLEIGHVQVLPGGAICGCGRQGCLEAEASRLAIAGAAANASYRGEAPYLQSQIKTKISKIRSGVLSDAIENGDKVVELIIDRAARLIGGVIGDVVNLLAPDVVVLGGGLVEAMPQRFIPPIREAALERVLPSLRDVFEVVEAKLGDDAGVMGAAAWAEKNFGKNG